MDLLTIRSNSVRLDASLTEFDLIVNREKINFGNKIILFSSINVTIPRVVCKAGELIPGSDYLKVRFVLK